MNSFELKEFFVKTFNREDCTVFSAPGRTEIAGNHTDHQNGKVLTAAVDLKCFAAAAKSDGNTVRIKSEGYKYFEMDVSSLDVKESEKGTSAALIRGILSGFKENGIDIGGFDAYVTSMVPAGSGLSSSAAFEVLICAVVNHFFADDKIGKTDIAKISQTAECNYFGKPCGLLDQMACSLGGCNYIDFCVPETPLVKSVDFSVKGYTLCVVNTGGSHSDLTNDYADITLENAEVSEFFSAEKLNQVDEKVFYENVAELRKKCGERAVLRAIHFFEEQKRVEELYYALKSGNTDKFLSLVNESGISSQNLLQNYYSAVSPKIQPITLCVELSKRYLRGKGAVRIHGGGFAGTVQCYVPDDMLDGYIKFTEDVFGKDSVIKLSIINDGGTVLI